MRLKYVVDRPMSRCHWASVGSSPDCSSATRARVEALARRLVEGVGVAHEQLGLRRVLADVEELLDEHAEGRAPVADVVLRDDRVADRGEHAVEAVADDRRAEVPDVHLLGHVRAGVVDDDALRERDGVDAPVRVLQQRRGRGREHVGAHAEVDEPRPGDLERLTQVVEVELRDDVGGHLTAQVTLELVVALEVVAQGDDLLVGEVTDAGGVGDAGGRGGLLGAGAAHAEDVGESDLDALLAREVDSDKTCHLVWFSCVRCGGLEQHRSAGG
jgi:hypothetical protein